MSYKTFNKRIKFFKELPTCLNITRTRSKVIHMHFTSIKTIILREETGYYYFTDIHTGLHPMIGYLLYATFLER